MHIVHVVGARPNFMKAAPVMRAIAQLAGSRQTLVHTGQHYDANMSDIFFQQLGIQEPDFNLAVGSGTHAQQTGEIMIRFEPVLLDCKQDMVLVYGDVNSTIAAALVSVKLKIKVGHVEAGLRSCDRGMPEEINRILTDRIADLLFTPSQDGDSNLIKEGVPSQRIHFVGNVMIDTLMRLRLEAARNVPAGLPGRFGLVTLHRPSNVDSNESLGEILKTLSHISTFLPIIFPVHPRTRQKIAEMGFKAPRDLQLWDPQSYLQFLALQEKATAVITDSGGIQEETTYLGVPCLTLRENTERPVTVTVGTNILVGRDLKRLCVEVNNIVEGRGKKGKVPPLWDGKASERIAAILQSEVSSRDLTNSVATKA